MARSKPSRTDAADASAGLVHLVDDDDGVRLGVAMLLRSAGYAVEAYPSALALLEAWPAASATLAAGPACILTDVRMPGLDGIGLLGRLRAMGNRMPVVVMTAHGDISTAVAAMKEGARDFIEKPFDDPILLEAIAGAMQAAAPAPEPRAADSFREAAARIAQLSRREREVLDELVAGHANKTIAHHLDLSERTVEVHRARMLQRLGVRSLSEAVRIAVWAELAGEPQARSARGQAEPAGGEPGGSGLGTSPGGG